jgi:hypothetical protein
MAKHFGEIGKFKTRVGADDFNPAEGDKDLSLCMIFHLADISNPTKPFEICKKWTELLYVEFFD